MCKLIIYKKDIKNSKVKVIKIFINKTIPRQNKKLRIKLIENVTSYYRLFCFKNILILLTS